MERESTYEQTKKRKRSEVTIPDKILSSAAEELKYIRNNLKVYSSENLIQDKMISQLVAYVGLYQDSDSEVLKLTVQVLSKLAEDGSGRAHKVVHKMVVSHGLAQLLVDILKGTASRAIRDEAMWGLGLVASNSVECRDLVLECGGMEAVVSCLLVKNSVNLRRGSWVLANLCRGEPHPRHELWELALRAVKHLIHLPLKNAETTRSACRALSYLSHGGSPEQIQAVLDTGACPRLLELVTNPFFAIPALRTIADIAAVQVQPVLDHGGLDTIKKMVGSKPLHTSIVNEASHVVSIIYASRTYKDQFHALLNPSPVKQEAPLDSL